MVKSLLVDIAVEVASKLTHCPNCGTETKGAKFCPECGTKVS